MRNLVFMSQLHHCFSHVHVPDFASPAYCNSTIRGRYGDALAELDDNVGQLLQHLKDLVRLVQRRLVRRACSHVPGL